ncbi:nuclear transport factor 2 family protein [Dickeya zeae]|uniref:Nuclear transport factor 2 family protein n=1 Tax=Dickeya zeae TaxID=204042 RepID=A0AAE7CY81_9GAMM|nr:nuclear transport factor 2 family protein [Dickeya zeae]QIZ50512.1 nuclear transport factor 2 family protein [Dickeya zeae]
MNFFKKSVIMLGIFLFIFPAYSVVLNNDLLSIKSVIKKYESSINDYDKSPRVAEGIWQQTPESTYIHPRGHEKGWDNIKNNFYQKTMVDTFISRNLHLVGKPDIHIYGNTAVIEFYWIFHAKFRKDNTQIITKGRETQVMVKTNGNWKIVHIHYSNMPVDGDRKGF